MLYFIDFDDTIFNAKLFKEDFKKIFLKNGIDGEEFERSYIPCKAGLCGKTFKEYNLEKQLADIESRHGKMPNLRNEIDLSIESTEEYVFDDFYEFIEKIPKKDVFIISFGNTFFQEKKIENSGILKYVNDYRLTSDSKVDCIEEFLEKKNLNKEKIFIDDRPDQIEEVKKEISEMTIYRMKRQEGRYNNLPTPQDVPEINRLTDISF